MVDLNKYGKYYAAGMYEQCRDIYTEKRKLKKEELVLYVILAITVCICPFLGLFI